MTFLSFKQLVNKIDQLEEANILIAALEFRVFTHLGKRRLTSRAFAQKSRIHPEGAEALLNALVSLGALKKSGNSFANTAETFRHFCEHSPQYKIGTVFLCADLSYPHPRVVVPWVYLPLIYVWIV